MSDDAAADQHVWFRHGVHHAVVHHTVVHHTVVHHTVVHHVVVHHAVIHHVVIHHAVVHLFSDEEHGDRLSDDAFFAAKILKKLLLMEGTVAHIISGKAVNSAACWVLELDNVSFCILLLERVEFGADSLALIGASATPGVENEANSKLLDFFSHRWLISKHVEGALSLHGVFWELTEFDLTTIWQVKELTDSEGWLVELGGNVGDRGRLELHVGREMAIGHNWLIWHDRLWLRSRCGVRHVMILLLCIWVVMLLLHLLLHLCVWIHLLLLLVMHNLAWVGRLMLLLLLSWLAVVGMGLLLLLLSMWVSLLLLLGWLMVGLLLLLLSMWVRLLLSIRVRLLLSMWVSLLLLLGWLMVGLLLLLLLSWLMVALLLLLLLSWLMVALLLLLLLSVWVLLLLLLSVWVLVHLLLRGMLVV